MGPRISIPESRISLAPESVGAGKYWEAKHVSNQEVLLTLGSASEFWLANRNILSNRSSLHFKYLPARDEGDSAMKHSS